MVTCAACGRENPDGFRFCGSCGSPLTHDVVATREVRKVITVVFCDLAGSTALGERLDPESLQRVLGQYFERMREVLERHQGTVEKFIGDAVVGVFGVPRLHEDDALRAVRAAVELAAALAELNKELERDWGVTLRIRTGVNTGEVVAGSAAAGSALVLGDAVNVAARLEQAATPGEVLLGQTTWELVRDAIQAEPVAPLALKGKAQGVAAWRLLGVSPDVPGHARRRDIPMVGREAERQLLLEAFDRVVAERACGLVTVLGAAGVGKTRLVDEALASVGERAVVLRGRCLSYGRASRTGRSPRWFARRPGSRSTTPSRLHRASWLRCSLARSRPTWSPAGSLRRWGWPRLAAGPRRPSGRYASSSNTWAAADRWWWSSTICTGRSRPCWISSSTWRASSGTRRCC
jgi:class 3 adenylate cyclase